MFACPEGGSNSDTYTFPPSFTAPTGQYHPESLSQSQILPSIDKAAPLMPPSYVPDASTYQGYAYGGSEQSLGQGMVPFYPSSFPPIAAIIPVDGFRIDPYGCAPGGAADSPWMYSDLMHVVQGRQPSIYGYDTSGFTPASQRAINSVSATGVEHFRSDSIPGSSYFTQGAQSCSVLPTVESTLFGQRDRASINRKTAGSQLAHSDNHNAIPRYNNPHGMGATIGSGTVTRFICTSPGGRDASGTAQWPLTENLHTAHDVRVPVLGSIVYQNDSFTMSSIRPMAGDGQETMNSAVAVSIEDSTQTQVRPSTERQSQAMEGLSPLVRSILNPNPHGRKRNAVPSVGLRKHTREHYNFTVDQKSVARVKRLIHKVSGWQQESNRRYETTSPVNGLETQLQLLTSNGYLGNWDMTAPAMRSLKGKQTPPQVLRWYGSLRQRRKRKIHVVTALIKSLETWFHETMSAHALPTFEEEDHFKELKLLQDTAKAISLMTNLEDLKPWK